MAKGWMADGAAARIGDCRGRRNSPSFSGLLSVFRRFSRFCGLWPRSKQRGTQADYRGPLFDRHLKITAHAHAQFRQRRSEPVLTTLLQLLQLAEDRADLLRLG